METKLTKAVWVSPEQLANNATVWEFVKHGLERVKAKIGSRSQWTPMHVRQAVINKGSELWLILDEETQAPLAFYILSQITDPFVQVPITLFVWIAYATPGEWHLIEKHLTDVKERARVLGLEHIEFLSPRHGWLRRLEKLGFTVREVIYGLDI